MRFAIAATVLASASSLKDDVALPFLQRANPSTGSGSELLEGKQKKGGFEFRADGHVLSIDQESLKDIRKKGGGLLKNLLRSEAVECDPKKAADPDVGVLACGVGRYCAESDESAMGGLCTDALDMEERKLQDENVTVWGNAFDLFCEQNSDKCDCTNDDMEAYTLTVDCVWTDVCRPKMSACGNRLEHCYNANYNIDITGPGMYARSFCYDDSAPYEQEVCYSGTVNGTEEEDFGCDMSFDGVTCNSCEVKFVDIGFCANGGNCTYFSNFPCYYFDCMNTNLNMSGNDCQQDGSPILEYMDTFGCVDCNICGDGLAVTAPDDMIPGYPYTCGDVQTAAMYGILTAEDCGLIQAYLTASGTCGCAEAVPTEAPGPTAPTPLPVPVASPSAIPPVPPVAMPVEAPSGASSLLGSRMVASVVGLSAMVIAAFAV